KLQSFKNIRVDDFFCNFLDKRFCFFFLKLEQIFIFQRSLGRRSNPESDQKWIASTITWSRSDASLLCINTSQVSYNKFVVN
ncbi:MAG: hypothetical protein LBH67_01315, partial [Rickettsia sp.]|nr:hypothetical protein [Rickettsia sp.]